MARLNLDTKTQTQTQSQQLFSFRPSSQPPRPPPSTKVSVASSAGDSFFHNGWICDVYCNFESWKNDTAIIEEILRNEPNFVIILRPIDFIFVDRGFKTVRGTQL